VLTRCSSVGSTCPCISESLNVEVGGEGHVEPAWVGTDYSFLGSAWTDATVLPKRLFPPGSLVVVHCMEFKGVEETALSKAYEVRPRPLGWGTFGEVVVARHRRTGTKRAIKSISKARMGNKVMNAREYVKREAEFLRQLDHPNVVRLYEVFEDNSNLYLVMELCEGGNLSDRLRADMRFLDEVEGAGVLVQVLSAVRHMHARGFVHRDLKMENLVIASAMERPWVEAPLVKLTDFGLAMKQKLTGSLRSSEVAGTREYMAPEVVAGRVAIPFADRTDMWSLGILLHKMLTGKCPPTKPAEISLEASYWTHDLLKALLRAEPESRPSAAVAARHSFFDLVHAAGRQHLLEAVQPLHSALRAFADAPRLRRLGLVAAARAADDLQLRKARQLFEAMEMECEGILSRQAMEGVLQVNCQPMAPMIRSLLRMFEFIDADGSGSIGWTEFSAVVLGLANAPPGEAGGADVDRGKQDIADACRLAFELLSQGGGLISGLTLGQLITRADPKRPAPRGSQGQAAGGKHGRQQRFTVEPILEDRFITDLDSMVREIDPSGAVKFKTFLELLLGPGASLLEEKARVLAPGAGAGTGTVVGAPEVVDLGASGKKLPPLIANADGAREFLN